MDTKNFGSVTIKNETLGEVEALISTFNVVDKDKDVVLPGSFTDNTPVVISSYNHTSWDGALPVGKGVVSETEKGAVLSGSFFMDTTHGRDAFLTVKGLADSGLGEWSYSLENVSAKMGEWDGESVRIIDKIGLREVSPVLAGASVGTQTLSTKNVNTFSDHQDKVLAELDGLFERASQIVALRASEGKSFVSFNDFCDNVSLKIVDFLKLSESTESNTDNLADELQRIMLRQLAKSNR